MNPLEAIREYGCRLSARQIAVLAQMQAKRDTEDGEIVYERGVGYLGSERIASATIKALLQACAISPDSFTRIGRGLERYTINETGREILAARDANARPR